MGATPENPHRLIADARVADAVEERRRRHAARQGAEAAARLSGTLLSLAEHGGDVRVHTKSGGTWRGPVAAVGADHCVVATPDGEAVLRLSAIASVRPPVEAVAGTAQDTRSVEDGERFLDRLRAAAEEAADAVLRLDGLEHPLRAQVLAVGADLLTVRLEGRGGTAYLALDAVTEALLPRRAR